jgi:hypothetical protein
MNSFPMALTADRHFLHAHSCLIVPFLYAPGFSGPLSVGRLAAAPFLDVIALVCEIPGTGGLAPISGFF